MSDLPSGAISAVPVQSFRPPLRHRLGVFVARLPGRHVDLVRSCRGEMLVATTLLLGTAAVGIAFGRHLPAGSLGTPMDAVSAEMWLAVLGDILATNLATAMLFFSGTITGGLTALACGAGAGMFLGHSIAVAVAELGIPEVLLRGAVYTLPELYGFILAFAAGLTTPARLLFRDEGTSLLDELTASWSKALSLVTHAAAALVLAALLETLTIAARG